MSLKRKIKKSTKEEVFDGFGEESTIFSSAGNNSDDDTTDEEDSNYNENDFEGMTIDSDFGEDDVKDSDEWEDISDDGEEDDDDDKFAKDESYYSDSDYVESVKEEETTQGKPTKEPKRPLPQVKKKLASKKKTVQDKASEKVKRQNLNKNILSNGVAEHLLSSSNEYEEDSSDEEDLRNTIGNIPINWYDEYDHLGYGLDSLPIFKPKKGDKLDTFLERLENPDYNRTVFDKQTGQDVRLSDAHVDMVNRLLSAKVPNAQFDMYAPFHDLYSHEVSEMPLSGRLEHKRSFIPSKHERKKVAVLAKLIRKGVYRRNKFPEKKKPKYYDLWKPRSEDDPRLQGVTDHIPPTKAPLPDHSESYNPPPEYLLNEQAFKSNKSKGKSDKIIKGSWRNFKSVREIPMHPRTLKMAYERLLDLYLAPRKRYMKVIAEAKDFLPKLPDKKDLRPYPTMEGIIFKGHQSIIRTISVHPCGKYIASGSDDHTVRIWEVNTGRCLRTFEVENAVKKVEWNPHQKLFLLAIAMGKQVVLLNPESYLTDKIVVKQTNAIFKEEIDQGDYIAPEKVKDAVTWRKPTEAEWQKGYRVVLEHFKEVKEVVWHRQGDFFASIIPEGNHKSVLIHQLSRWRSQLPFTKNKGLVQTVAFHPKQPQLFVATQTHVRLYNLKSQGLLKKIQANSRYISCLAVHPGGEHFIVGGHDRRINWFELGCTKRPHCMRYHVKSVRNISFHRKYPLYASCSDDPIVIVAHATVYDDMLKDPLIVPVKQLKRHKKFEDYYVLDVAWHPHEPYLFTAGADATIRLWH